MTKPQVIDQGKAIVGALDGGDMAVMLPDGTIELCGVPSEVIAIVKRWAKRNLGKRAAIGFVRLEWRDGTGPDNIAV